jgi:hypothetical protein
MENRIAIEFTSDQLATLDKAIQQLPYFVAAPLIAHINRELQKLHDLAADERDIASGVASS